ncbi:unnamed protein product [Linum trigynum]|uniref:Expansin-like EG45 domain-containing protein n=1 Tax=Linum trigynum TaxID=586398 RepID=A0AAV2EHS5_9ROSI
MARNQNSLLLLSLLLLLVSSVRLALSETGTASFTNARYSEQSCTEKAPTTPMFTGVSDKLYGNGDICGTKYSVTCVGGVAADQPSPCRTSTPVVVTVTDSCSPGSDEKPCPTFVLSAKAFALIANPRAGEARITYER